MQVSCKLRHLGRIDSSPWVTTQVEGARCRESSCRELLGFGTASTSRRFLSCCSPTTSRRVTIEARCRCCPRRRCALVPAGRGRGTEVRRRGRNGVGGLARSSDGFTFAGAGVADAASRPAAARPTAAAAVVRRLRGCGHRGRRRLVASGRAAAWRGRPIRRLRGRGCRGRRRRVASDSGTAMAAWRGPPAAVPRSETTWELGVVPLVWRFSGVRRACGGGCRGCGSRRGRRPGHPGHLRRLGVGGQAGLGEAPAGRRPGNRSRVRRATESTVPPRPPSPPRRP